METFTSFAEMENGMETMKKKLDLLQISIEKIKTVWHRINQKFSRPSWPL